MRRESRKIRFYDLRHTFGSLLVQDLREDGDAMKEVGFEKPVTSRVAAPLIGVHYKTLEQMARTGNIPAPKIGKSCLFRLLALSA